MAVDANAIAIMDAAGAVEIVRPWEGHNPGSLFTFTSTRDDVFDFLPNSLKPFLSR